MARNRESEDTRARAGEGEGTARNRGGEDTSARTGEGSGLAGGSEGEAARTRGEGRMERANVGMQEGQDHEERDSMGGSTREVQGSENSRVRELKRKQHGSRSVEEVAAERKRRKEEAREGKRAKGKEKA